MSVAQSSWFGRFIGKLAAAPKQKRRGRDSNRRMSVERLESRELLTTLMVPSVYHTIQSAINAAKPYDTIKIAAGTYREQLTITKHHLTLTGAGSSTVIRSPGALAPFTSPNPDNPGQTFQNYPVIYVHDTGHVVLKNLKVDGAGLGKNKFRFEGIAYYRAGGTINTVEVTNISEVPVSNTVSGVGIFAYAPGGARRTVTVVNSNVHNFQNTGIVLAGAFLTGNVRSTKVTGMGDTNVTTQNGIQLSDGAVGTVANNKLSGFSYLKDDVRGSAAILAYKTHSPIVIQNNLISTSQIGVFTQFAPARIVGNRIFGHLQRDWGIEINREASILGNTIQGTGGAISINAGGGTGVTVARNSITNNLYGVDIVSGTVTLNQNTFSKNKVAVNLASGTLAMSGNTLTSNTYATFIRKGSATLAKNTITQNSVGVDISGGKLVMTRNSVHNNDWGVRVDAPVAGDPSPPLSVRLNYNAFYQDKYYGVLNNRGVLVDATFNTWGDPLGPRRPNGNHNGVGDWVAGNVKV